MGAGATFTEAVKTIVRHDEDDPLDMELKALLAEIDLGTTRRDALRNMADRVPLEAMQGLVASVTQAEELGTPLTAVLHDQATLLRERSQPAGRGEGGVGGRAHPRAVPAAGDGVHHLRLRAVHDPSDSRRPVLMADGRPAELIFVVGPQRGQRVALRTAVAIAGRGTQAEIPLLEETVSRQQMRFELTAQGWLVESLSKNSPLRIGKRKYKPGKARAAGYR